MTPFHRLLDALERNGCRVTVRRGGARAFCPAHPDRRPSLGITDKVDRVLMHCFANCPIESILTALGLTKRDLFANPPSGQRLSSRREESAVYEYVDLDGAIQFQKVRYEPKSFRMRVPDATAPGRFRWNARGRNRVLYRWPDLLDCRRIVVLEGEKAVELLWKVRVPATCGPTGAGNSESRRRRLRVARCLL